MAGTSIAGRRIHRMLVIEEMEPRIAPAAGGLDYSFDGDGKVTTDFGAESVVNAMAIQSDGKIVVAGSFSGGSYADFAIARYNADGSLDTSFDGDGKVTTSIRNWDSANAVVIQLDGKIVVAGSTAQWDSENDFALARYNSDGSLDTSFGTEGKVTTNLGGWYDGCDALALQSDGKIVAAGLGGDNKDFALARYNSDGSLDTSFGSGGKVITDFGGWEHAYGVAIQSDGKIVLVGDDFALARYNADGSLDSTFDGDGKVTTDFGSGDVARSVAIQSDGKIIAAGYCGGNFTLARYSADGSLDTTFDGDGKVTTDFGGNVDRGYAVAIQTDGKIIVAGQWANDPTPFDHDSNFAVARYNSDGSLDTTFGSDGKVTTDFGGYSDFANAVAIQSDGKIVAAGSFDANFALARYWGSSIVYVDKDATGADNGTSWANAFANLQSALAAATNGDEIWVATGTYTPTSGTDRAATFQLLSDVSLYGGFAGTETSRDERDWAVNVTILSGDIGVVDDVSDNSYHVVVGANDSVLDGFTISGGYANTWYSPPASFDGCGGGMFNGWVSNLIVANCTFSQNTADYYGGGMYNDGVSDLIVANCTFSLNGAYQGGGMYNKQSPLTLTNCTFSSNRATNTGGGMWIWDSSSATVTNCTFSQNTAGGGGGMGIYGWSPTVTNCTFSGNSAVDMGGAMYNWISGPKLTNCILWNNTSPEDPGIYNRESTPIISFSDIQGCGGSGAGWKSSLGTDGGGNIDADPLFVNASDPDGPDNIFGTADDGLYLSLASPCVNSATSAGAPSTDIVGTSRPQGAGYDMGAYERPILYVYQVYQQDFSSGKPSDNWTYYSSTGGGRIEVVNGALRMVSDGTMNLNEAILSLDLTGLSKVTLEFDHRDSLDEPNPLPNKGADWGSEHQNGDGIAISDDGGVTWRTVLSLGRENTWRSYTLDLDQAIAAAGMSYTSNFRIKFQQYDNHWWGLDGREFDNIVVSSSGVAPIDYAQDFSSGKPNGADGWQYYSSYGGGQIQVVSGALRMTSDGTNNLNEAILSLNLDGQSNVQLQFKHRDSSDDLNTMPTGTWSGHEIGDGVAISDDGGATWYTIASLGREASWTTHTIDLDTMIAAAGMSYTATFQIKFQQYDNHWWELDGREFDDIVVRAAPVQPIDYTEDFPSGKPHEADGWQYYSSMAGGRIEVVDGALRMDSDGTNNLNEAILCLNLSGQSNVFLQFKHRDSSDELNTMPTGTWSGHEIGDGVAISDDGGANWYSIVSLGRELSWTTHTIDLDAMIVAAGMSYTATFQIKFQQYDNHWWGLDGREFDNISVQAI